MAKYIRLSPKPEVVWLRRHVPNRVLLFTLLAGIILVMQRKCCCGIGVISVHLNVHFVCVILCVCVCDTAFNFCNFNAVGLRVG